jgi:hypothetical protein
MECTDTIVTYISSSVTTIRWILSWTVDYLLLPRY